MDRCVSASRFRRHQVFSRISARALVLPDHLAIAHNPLPSNNHLSQIHLRPRAGSPLITLPSPALSLSSLPTTDHFLIPGIIYGMTKCPHFLFSFYGTLPPPLLHCVPCRPSHLRYGRFSAANISYSRETSMQRLGTTVRGKTLKTSPPAMARRRGQFFGQKLEDWVPLERGKICADSFWYFRPIYFHSG